MKIERILNTSTAFLKQHNINNPSFDSEILLSKTINKDRKFVITNPNTNLKNEDVVKFNSLIERRCKGEPVAYLINQKEFWKYSFYVNKNVLIPRPDTELIIEQILKLYSKCRRLQILDIGTGSGCIILSLLKERINFKGIGIDISKQSIKISKYNAKMLNLSNRIKFYNSDVDNFKIGKYDIIVSNPPYIKFNDLKYLENDVAHFEPKMALSGGFDGFSKIRKVINKAASLIKKNGKLFLEIGFDQKETTKRLLMNKGFYINDVIKDYGKNNRCIISARI